MGRLMARVYDRMMKGSEEACLREWRSELLSSVHGKVLEVGAGTGVSLPLYPTTVTRVVLSEPDRHMRAKMAQRIQKAAELPVEVSDGSVEAIPFPDESFDFVTCMLVLCSVPDLQHAVGEIRRVLVPGGSLVFLEHVAASNRPDRLKWQRRLEPFWKRISGNCHLTRKTEEAILADGFTMERVKRESMRKANPLVRSCIRGVAVKRP
jgi:ubiquinone/menaquinone biosynthesis C-methylase UbiE